MGDLTAYKEGDLFVFKKMQPDEDGAMNLLPVVNAPKYRRFGAFIEWLEPTLPGDWAENWFGILGEREDGIYTAIEEFDGDLQSVGEAAISAKDRFYLSSIYVDDDEKTNVRTLRDIRRFDGLCGYDYEERGPLKVEAYVRDPSFWPTYRDRHTITALLPWPPDVKPTGISNYEQLRYLAAQKRFRYRDETPRVSWLLRQEPPLDRILLHPLLKGLCRLLTMMERTKEDPNSRKHAEPNYWYGNPR